MSERGLFITFEGCEGAGKSYQSGLLYRKLADSSIPAILTHEPGGTPLGEKISRLLKWEKDQKLSPLTEMLLFNAARAHHIDTVIKPALNSGKVVICDRFTASTVVYQGYARGLNQDLIRQVNEAATQGIKPDLIILLDIPVEQGLARKRKNKPDRFHRENVVFHRRVRNGFLKQAVQDPEHWLYVDGRQTREKITGIIWDRVSWLLTLKRC